MAAHLSVALRVFQQVQQEHGGLLGPPRLTVGAVLVLGLHRAAQPLPTTCKLLRSENLCLIAGLISLTRYDPDLLHSIRRRQMSYSQSAADR